MDSDRIGGAAKETLGKAQSAAGEVFGDKETELKGHAREASGTAQNVYGQAKDALGDAADSAQGIYGQAKEKLGDTFGDTFSDASGSAERALHSLEKEVKDRPLIALLIAALVGYVLAQLTTR